MMTDKLLHGIAGASITLLVGLNLNIPLGVIATLLAGAAKELWDLAHGKHDQKEAWADMAWNALGAGLAVLALILLSPESLQSTGL